MGMVHYFIVMYSLWYYFGNLLPTDHQKISRPVTFGIMNTLSTCKSVRPAPLG